MTFDCKARSVLASLIIVLFLANILAPVIPHVASAAPPATRASDDAMKATLGSTESATALSHVQPAGSPSSHVQPHASPSSYPQRLAEMFNPSLFSLAFAQPQADPWFPNWQYRKSMTIDHNRVSADLTNFPVLISIATDSDLASKAQSNGYDIVFTDSSGSTKLNHEIESYTQATGQLSAWVNVPNLSSTTDTVLYMYYGNPSASNQQNVNAVWDSHFKMVHHLSEASGTQHDSTSNGYNAVPNGGVSQGVTGKIGGADSFASSSQYLGIGNIGGTSDWTFSFWANSRDVSCLACYPIGLGGAAGIGLGGSFTNIANDFYVYDGSGSDSGVLHGGPTVQTNVWYYVTVAKSGTTYTVYANGVSVKSGTIANIAITNLIIARRADGILPFNGIVDEVRISDTPRSGSWILTEYNNQNSPSSFSTAGVEESSGAPVVANPSPSNGQTGVPVATSQLSFDLSSTAPMDYTVTTSPSIGSGQGSQVTSGRYNVPVSGLGYNTIYTWSVHVTDGTVSTDIAFTFTTESSNRQITSYSPSERQITLDRGGSQTFQISFNGPMDTTWYLDGVQQQYNPGVSSSSWTYTFNNLGIFTVTSTGTYAGLTLTQEWSVQVIINFNGGIVSDGNLYFQPSQPWEKGWVFDSSIWKENGIYYDLYAGGPIGQRQIGFAWSYDGLHWTKYASNPILSPVPGTWESKEVFWPGSIVKMADGTYRVYYQGIDTSGGAHSGVFFMTLSGTTITSLVRYSGNPIVADTYELTVAKYTDDLWLGYNGACVINFLTSTDGLHWSYVQRNVNPGSGWSTGCVYPVRMLIMDGTLYLTLNVANIDVGIDYARVGDWTNLARSPYNPLVSHGTGYRNNVLGGIPLYNSDLDTLDVWFLSVESLGGTGQSGIGFGRFYHVTGQNTPPIVSNPLPSDEATDVPVSTSSLSYDLADYDGDTMSYTVTTSPNIGGGSGTNVKDGQQSVNVAGLSYSTTYTWTVTVNDGTFVKTSTFTFTTEPRQTFDPFLSGWQYRTKITVDHNQVVGDETNFPILIDIADSDLHSKACSNMNDILFMNGAGEALKLKHQIEFHDSAAGHLTAWVKIPALSSTTDTVIYMYYGNPACSNQQDTTRVWDSNFVLILHLNENAGTQADSTSYHNDGTPNGVTQGIAGRIDGADSFSGSSSYVESTNDASLSSNEFTLEAWIKPDTVSGTRPIIEKYDMVDGKGSYLIRQQDSNILFDLVNGISDHPLWANGVLLPGNWYYVVGTYDGSTMSIYLNGNLVAQTSTTFSVPPSSQTLKIGTRGNDKTPSSFFFSGIIDEARVSDIARSSGWIKTQYDNQNTPSTFVTISSEEQNTAATTTTLNAISSPLTAGQTAVGFSGSVSPSTVLDGINVELHYASTCVQGIGGTIAATVQTSSGNGAYTGTFTAPPAGNYQFWAYFAGSSSYGSSSSTCQQVTVDTQAGIVVTLNAISPQYFTLGSTVSYSGSVTIDGLPAPDGTIVGIEVYDHLPTHTQGEEPTHTDQVKTTGGTFSASFIMPTGAEGQWYAYAASGTSKDSKTFFMDATNPTLTLPSPITAEATGPAGAAVAYTATASDSLSGVSTFSCSPSSGSTFALGDTTVTCTATDNAGNTASGTFKVTVHDTTGPVVTVPSDKIVEATSSSGAVVDFTASASDVVDGSLTPTCTPASGSTFTLGESTVTCTATDAHSNVGSKSFNIAVQDTTAPVVTVPSDMTLEATGPSGAVVTFTSTATDVVDGPLTSTCAPASGSVFPVAKTTVTCSATDAHGNRASSSFFVTVQDETAPTVTVPGDMTVEATGSSGAVATFTATATDVVDGSLTPTCAPASGGTFALGSTKVTCTATDKAGNTGSASFNVIVQDTTAPTLSGLTDKVVEATSPSGAVVSFTVTALDAFDGAVIPVCTPPSGSTFPLGDTTVTCTATDTHSNAATGSFKVTVQDKSAPVVTVPSDMTLEATGPTGAIATFTASAVDAVDGSLTPTCTPASGGTFGLGSTSVTCTATDLHGNTGSATFNVIVQDKTPPTLTLPPDTTKEATSPSGAIADFTATATDIVDGSVAVSCSPASSSTFGLGVNIVNCEATDAHGNKATGTFKITVVDTTAPVVTVPADMTVEATGPSGAAVTFTATATDIVDGPLAPTCTPASGSTFTIGSTPVTCTATDNAGNPSSKTFNVIVHDTTVPTVSVPADITMEATSSSGATVTFTVSASDLVDGPVTPTCAPASGGTFALGSTKVTCTATDKAGNTGSASFNVIVQDTTPPAMNVPADITQEATSAAGADVSFTVTAADLVDGSVPVTCIPAAGTFPIATTTVTCTATDTHYNTRSESFHVTVQDTTAPTLTLPSPINVQAPGPTGVAVTYSALAHDIVDGDVPPVCVPASGSTFPLGKTTVTCTATDAHGNHASGSFDVTVTETMYTISITPVGSGTVTKSPDYSTYHLGDVVTLTAAANAGWGFSAWTGGLVGSTTPAQITIDGNKAVTATFIELTPTVTVIGAYHGARLTWSTVGVPNYNIYYNTVNDVNSATKYTTTAVSATTYDVANLPSSTWGHAGYFWVAPVRSDGEASRPSWGSGSDKVWIYKIEITSVTVAKGVAGDVKVHVEYRSRYLESGGITVGIEIGEFLGPGTEGNVPSRPIAISSTRPISLASFMSTGSINFESSSGEFVSGSNYKAWIFLWNQLPSDPGYWEAYADKAELIPITIP